VAGNTELNGTPEEIAAFERWKRARIEREQRLIASGWLSPGDTPDDLTEEDEKILDEAWAELRAEKGIVLAEPVDGAPE
jgi:hypothetical protein